MKALKGFWQEFKKFISRGNVVDLAVAVVIGGAFGKIVTGFVNYILNPFIGIFMKSGSLDSIKTVIHEAEINPETLAVIKPEVAILWGTWLQTIVDFLIIALCIFIVITIIAKVSNAINYKKLAKEKAEQEAKDKEKAEQEAAQAVIDAQKAQKEEELKASLLNQEKLLNEILTELKKK